MQSLATAGGIAAPVTLCRARDIHSPATGGSADRMINTQDDEFSLRKIIRWLRCYLDWKGELSAEAGIPSVTDFSRPMVQGGGQPGGSMVNGVIRDAALAGRVSVVDLWLNSLTWGERLAAEYWLKDEDGTVTEVAVATGLDFRQAKLLCQCIPLIIWSRFYTNIPDTDR